MARLHSDKARQLGGIIALAGFLFLAANVYGEDTGERGIAIVIGGAVIAFLAGYLSTPKILEWLRAKKAGRRSTRHSSKRSRK